MSELLSAYRPGSTLLHRIPAGPKVGLLAAYGVYQVLHARYRRVVAP